MFYHVIYSVKQNIATVTLNWPERNNVLDGQMISELIQVFATIQRDNNIKIVLLRSEGETFSIGFDNKYLETISKYDFNQNLEDSAILMKLFQQIYTLRKPVIALVHGAALSSGCGLANVCDFTIAARETAKFGYTEIKIGLIPAVSLIFLIRRIGEGRAREFVLNGDILSADKAFEIGLVNKVVPAIKLEETGMNLADELLKNNNGAPIGLVKELFTRIYGMSTSDALDYVSNLDALTRMTDDCKRAVKLHLNNDSVN